MRIIRETDTDAGTVTVTMTMPIQSDPDRMADLAWGAVTREMESAQRRTGTVPPGLRAS